MSRECTAFLLTVRRPDVVSHSMQQIEADRIIKKIFPTKSNILHIAEPVLEPRKLMSVSNVKFFFSLLILIKLSYLRMHNVHIVQFLYFFCLHCLCIVHISDSFDTGAYSCMQIDNISYFRCNSNIYIEASAECNRHIVTNGQMLNGEMKTRRTRI